MSDLKQLSVEFLGTTLLLTILASSGLVGEMFAGGNIAVARLANGAATGAGLFVLITLLGPFSGAHFNPVVSLMFWRLGRLSTSKMLGYCLAQFTGAICGVWLTHLLFALPVLQISAVDHPGTPFWFSELVSTLILLSVIRLGDRFSPHSLPALVALTVTSGAWFTPSTFFCNPAISMARCLTDSFVGLSPASAISFTSAELVAAFVISALLHKGRFGALAEPSTR